MWCLIIIYVILFMFLLSVSCGGKSGMTNAGSVMVYKSWASITGTPVEYDTNIPLTSAFNMDGMLQIKHYWDYFKAPRGTLAIITHMRGKKLINTHTIYVDEEKRKKIRDKGTSYIFSKLKNSDKVSISFIKQSRVSANSGSSGRSGR